MNKQKNFIYISILYNPNIYRDRFKLLIEEQNLHKDKNIVIIGRPFNKNIELKNIELINSKSYFSFAIKTAFLIRKIKKKHKATLIINEHLVGLAGLITKILNFKNVIRIANLYSSEFYFIYKKGWRIDPNGRNFIEFKQKFKILLSRIKPILYRLITIWSADFYIGNSKQIIHDINDKKKNNFFVTNTNIDIFPDIHSLSKPSQFLDNKIHLLYVGKIYPAKGIGTLFSAISQLKGNNHKLHLLLIGKIAKNDKNWFENLIRYYNIENHITHIGPIDQQELFSYYKYTNAFIMPSFFEGSPRVLKEALIAGCPIIASNIEGNKILETNQNNIKYFEPGNANDLKKLIVEITQTQRHINQTQGVDFYKKFSSISIAKDRINIYSEIINRNNKKY